jgi:hypothetical protein
MFNTLEMTTIAHNGFGQHNPLADRYEASAAFERPAPRPGAPARLLGGSLRRSPRWTPTRSAGRRARRLSMSPVASAGGARWRL